MITIFRRQKSNWVFNGYECPDCGQYFSTEKRLDKHPEVCTRINTINREKEELNTPVVKIVKNGVTYYRHGSNGMLHDNYKDAEREYKQKPKLRPYSKKVKEK